MQFGPGLDVVLLVNGEEQPITNISVQHEPILGPMTYFTDDLLPVHFPSFPSVKVSVEAVVLPPKDLGETKRKRQKKEKDKRERREKRANESAIRGLRELVG